MRICFDFVIRWWRTTWIPPGDPFESPCSPCVEEIWTNPLRSARVFAFLSFYLLNSPTCACVWTDKPHKEASDCLLQQSLLCLLWFNFISQTWTCVSTLTLPLAAACQLSRMFLPFLADAICFNFRSRRVRKEGVSTCTGQVSFSLRRFLTFLDGWSEWVKWMGGNVEDEQPSGSILLDLRSRIAFVWRYMCLSRSSFTLSFCLVLERVVWISYAWFCFCCCLHL